MKTTRFFTSEAIRGTNGTPRSGPILCSAIQCPSWERSFSSQSPSIAFSQSIMGLKKLAKRLQTIPEARKTLGYRNVGKPKTLPYRIIHAFLKNIAEANPKKLQKNHKKQIKNDLKQWAGSVKEAKKRIKKIIQTSTKDQLCPFATWRTKLKYQTRILSHPGANTSPNFSPQLRKSENNEII